MDTFHVQFSVNPHQPVFSDRYLERELEIGKDHVYMDMDVVADATDEDQEICTGHDMCPCGTVVYEIDPVLSDLYDMSQFTVDRYTGEVTLNQEPLNLNYMSGSQTLAIRATNEDPPNANSQPGQDQGNGWNDQAKSVMEVRFDIRHVYDDDMMGAVPDMDAGFAGHSYMDSFQGTVHEGGYGPSRYSDSFQDDDYQDDSPHHRSKRVS